MGASSPTGKPHRAVWETLALTLPGAPETASFPDSKSGCVISQTGLGNNSAFDSRPTLPFPGSGRGWGGTGFKCLSLAGQWGRAQKTGPIFLEGWRSRVAWSAAWDTRGPLPNLLPPPRGGGQRQEGASPTELEVKWHSGILATSY